MDMAEILDGVETADSSFVTEKHLNSLAHAALKLSTQYENPERELLQNLATFFFNKRIQKLAGAK